MLMGESDQSVAPLEEQVEAVRPFLPDGVPFSACPIPGKAVVVPYRFYGPVKQAPTFILLYHGLWVLARVERQAGVKQASKHISPDVIFSSACPTNHDFGSFV